MFKLTQTMIWLEQSIWWKTYIFKLFVYLLKKYNNKKCITLRLILTFRQIVRYDNQI